MRTGKFTLVRALAEVFLIVVGISIALAFDTFIDNRKDRKQELEILRNLENDLRVMIQRSEEAIRFNMVCYDAGMIILKDLENPAQKTYRDSLNKYYGKFYFYDYPEIKQSGLLTLQATGIDLITDDSLRIAIIDFYDLHSLKASYVGESYTDQFNDVIDPIMHDHIRILNVQNEARPVNYIALKQDADAINTLNNILFHRLSLIGHIRNSIPHMHSLANRIQREIAEQN